MISSVIHVKTVQGSYEFQFRSRYTIVQGKGGQGKTSLLEQDHIKYPLPRIIVPVDSVFGMEDALTFEERIIMFDESLAEALTYELIDRMEKSTSWFVVFCRDLPTKLHYSYTDIYYMHSSGKSYSLRRLYPDLDTLPDRNISVVCEDSGSGYEYFASRIKDVRTAFGNGNILNVAYPGDTVIADGYCFGNLIDKFYDDYQLYLPGSFESLVATGMFNHDGRVNAPYDNWDFTKHKTLERYYTELLQNICADKGLVYTKKHLPDFCKDIDLIGASEDSGIPEELLYHPIWKKFCSKCRVQQTYDTYVKLCEICKSSDVATLLDYISNYYQIEGGD